MNNKTVIILLLIIAGITACHTTKKMEYDFPLAMSPKVRQGFTEICDQGNMLYNKNCARCHNTLVKGRKVIPDFAQEKLIGYSIRISNARHESSMPDSLVTEEELGQIMTFLTYKPKNNSGFRK